MFEKVSRGDFILAMFEKVCHGDNMFNVSFRQELRKSFLVPDFTTAMSLASIWYVNRKRISRRINLYMCTSISKKPSLLILVSEIQPF